MLVETREFMNRKKSQDILCQRLSSVQDMINIKAVSLDGTFQIDNNRYSRSYIIVDTNYEIKEYNEQLLFLEQWCKVINTFDCDVKISIINKKRDIDYFKNNMLYPLKGDVLDNSRKAYNDIIWDKAIEKKNGLEQLKIVTITVIKDNYREATDLLDSTEINLIKNFASIQSELLLLDSDERLNLLLEMYNPGKKFKLPHLLSDYMGNCRDWRNDLIPAKAEFKNNFFIIDDMYYKADYVTKMLPSNLSDKFFREITNLLFISIVSIDYIAIPKNVAKKTLEDKYMGVESAIEKVRQKKANRKDFVSEPPYKLRRQKSELESMLNDLNDNDQNMFWIGITIVFAGKTKKELIKNENSLKTIMDKYTCHLAAFSLQQREAFNSVLPIGTRQTEMMRSVFTQSACIFNPFVTQEIHQVSKNEIQFPPMYYGVNQVTQIPIFVNRKNLINGNGFVFGVPGGGKSFTGSKFEIGSVFMQTEDDIIIVDPTPKLEYFSVSDAFGGTKMNLSLDTDLFFNPLDVDFKELKHKTESVITEKSVLIQGICEQAMEGRMDGQHASLVDRAVRILYRRLSEYATEPVMPIMSDFCKVLYEQKEEKVNEILLALELFVDGSYNIFNHQTNVDVKNRLTVFGMRDLTTAAKLSGVSMLIVLEVIKNRILRNALNNRATWLYIDEIHILLKSPYARNYLVTLFKTVRKEGGICTGITQNVCDLLKDPDTSTLISNSEYTMFLKQSAIDVNLLLKSFQGMNREHINYVTNAEPGKGLIRFGETIIPMDNRIEKGNPIYDIYNTNLHEKAALEKLNRKKLENAMF